MTRCHAEPWRRRFLLLATFAVAGCRDAEPPPTLNRDLGDGRVVLLPTSTEWQDSRIARGQADWHPFRKPSADEPPPSADAEPEREGGQDPQVESEIRELVAEYNQVVGEGNAEAVLEYHVPDQQDRLKLLFDAGTTRKDTVPAIRSELTAKLPDAVDRVDAAMSYVEGRTGMHPLALKDITVKSDTEVLATAAGPWITEQCRFVVLDEEWYIEAQGLPAEVDLRATLADESAQIEGWLSALQAGQTPPGSILAQIESAAQTARASGAGDTGEENALPEDAAATAADDQPDGDTVSDDGEGG